MCEGNHHSSHQCAARPSSIFATSPRPPSHPDSLSGGEWSPGACGERVSEEEGF